MQVTKSQKYDGFAYHRYRMESSVSGGSIDFGILRPSDVQIEGTVYFVHGGNGDDEQFAKEGLFEVLSSKAKSLLTSKKYQIVFPRVGISFLKEDLQNPLESVSDQFLQDVLPHVERGTRTSSRSRFMSGLSMGGHAALNLFLRKPELFNGVGAMFPGIIGFSPFDQTAVQEYQKRTKISDVMLKILLDCYYGAFKNEAEYFKHDPFQLIQTVDKNQIRNKPIYLDVGSKDEFGFYEGVLEFSKILQKENIDHFQETVAGGLHNIDYIKTRHSLMIEYLLLNAK